MAQIFIAILICVTIVSLNILEINSILLWMIIGGFMIISIGLNLITTLHATKPAKELLAAIIKISGEKPEIQLSNSNLEKNEKTGLHDALQTIHELASKYDSKNELNSDNNSFSNSSITEALDMTICGFVAFNSDRQIIYSNRSASIHIDSNGLQTLELLFNDSDNLNTWLDSCTENSVHAERIWTRIPNRLPDQEGRRFFDVIASYHKGATSETVITLIDRTSTYIVDEENLDFIAFAAHELRGPITVIRGYLDVLNDELAEVLQNDQAELFRCLVVSSNRLAGYIDNILNTSRYDRRHLKMHLAEDSIANIYSTISDDMNLRAGSQNRLLSIDIPPNLPTVAADRTSIGEVLGNLIDNAIKYSNEGGMINVSAVTNDDFVDISITDHGIGMPESVVSQLFQKFYRSHRSRETVAGTGIGLYISKAIIESHGGRIGVRSQDGLGSTFTVSIPIYATVADKLKAGDNSNEGLISEGRGWIKNHSMYRS